MPEPAATLLSPPDDATAERLCRCYMLAVADSFKLTDPHELWEQGNWQARAMWVVLLRKLEHLGYDQIAAFAHSQPGIIRNIFEQHCARWPGPALERVRTAARAYFDAADPAAGTGILVTSDLTSPDEVSA